MNQTSNQSEIDNLSEEARSEDQRAITDYYASEAYARTQTRCRSPGRSKGQRVWPDRLLSPATSFCMGLIGLSLILVASAAVAPMLAGVVRWLLDPGTHFVVFAILDQAIMFPVLAGFVFATITPMFWYGAVMVRCGIAAATVLPGCIAFLFFSASIGRPDGYWTIVMVMFFAVGSLPVLTQLSSQWALSHSRNIDIPATPVGTRSIMELTIVTAVGCAVCVNIDTSQFIESLLLFTALGALASVAAIAMMIAFLRVEGRSVFAGGIAILFALGVSFVYSAMLAFLEFGWAGLLQRLLLISTAAFVGAVILFALMCFYLWWLGSCGWACVSKSDEKLARESQTHEPWRYWFKQA